VAAAIDGQHLAGGGAGGDEIEQGGGEVAGVGAAAKRQGSLGAAEGGGGAALLAQRRAGADGVDADARGEGLRELPLGHGADPADIAEGVIHILAMRAMTGQMIALDGGEHLEWPERRGPTPRRTTALGPRPRQRRRDRAQGK